MHKGWKTAGAIIVAVGLVLTGALTVVAQGPRERGWDTPEGLREGPPMMGPRQGGILANNEAIAEALGLTTDELRTQLRDGVTLADLAEEKGVALQDLRDIANNAQKASALDRVSQALTHGKITDAFAKWFNRGVDAGYVLDFQGRPVDNPTITAAAEALGMEPEQVELQMWAGRTLSDLSDQAGVQFATVQTAVETARKAVATERVQQAVADGRITQAQADWVIEGINEGFNAQSGIGGREFGRGMMPFMGDHPRDWR